MDGAEISYERQKITGFDDLQDLRLPKGLFTDDTAMALCIADSLIQNDYQLNLPDIRHRY